MESLNELKLLATGGQAEIYLYGGDKVLRVLRNPGDEELLKNEMEIMRSLGEKGIFVPKVYEFLHIEGRPAAIVERLAGKSMQACMQKNPFSIWKEAGTLASLHLELAGCGAVNGLKEAKGRAKHLTDRAEELSRESKEFIHELIESLPEGSDLCHGDFHPGNIIRSNGRDYIIDWFGAYRGDILSDAAHTYLVLKNMPRYPGLGSFQYNVLKISASVFAGLYLKAFGKLKAFDRGQFSKWLAVKAAERSAYGAPSEKPGLKRFIEACERAKDDPASWYRMI